MRSLRLLLFAALLFCACGAAIGAGGFTNHAKSFRVNIDVYDDQINLNEESDSSKVNSVAQKKVGGDKCVYAYSGEDSGETGQDVFMRIFSEDGMASINVVWGIQPKRTPSRAAIKNMLHHMAKSMAGSPDTDVTYNGDLEQTTLGGRKATTASFRILTGKGTTVRMWYVWAISKKTRLAYTVSTLYCLGKDTPNGDLKKAVSSLVFLR